MSEKSFIGMLTEHCPICGNKSGDALVMDARLKDSIEKDNHTWGEPCEECKERLKEFNALIVVKNEYEEKTHIKQEEAERTGEILWIKKSVCIEIFGADNPICFISEKGAEFLKPKE